jgi:hypothetical protein
MFHLAPLDSVVKEMLATGDDARRSMGWNLFHDQRIDSARFGGFDSYVSLSTLRISCADSMKRAVRLYHQFRVQRRSLADMPEFLDGTLNSANFHGMAPGLPALHGSKLLVRVLNLSGLGSVYGAARVARVPEFDLLPASSGALPLSTARPPMTISPSDVMEWLDRKLALFKDDTSTRFDRSRLRSHPFLLSLLDFVNKNRRDEPYQPVWATQWTEFSGREWDQPACWNQMLGVRPADEPKWLLLLRYPAREAGQIVRPTQLDGGWYAEHFPTPPSAPCGHSMDLDSTRRDRRHLPEFIHQQMDHTPDHLVACARLEPTPAIPLPPPQRRHLRILARDYRDVPAWATLPHPAMTPP